MISLLQNTLKEQILTHDIEAARARCNYPWMNNSAGLRYCHIRINANTGKNLEIASFLYALIELLNEKGILTIEDLDERKKQVAERLVQNFKESGIGLMYQDPEYDKYTFEHEAHLDCLSRLHICKAIC